MTNKSLMTLADEYAQAKAEAVWQGSEGTDEKEIIAAEEKAKAARAALEKAIQENF